MRHMPVAAAVFDRELRCLEASDGWRAAYCLDHSQIPGIGLYDQFSEISAASRERVQRGLAGEAVRIDQESLPPDAGSGAPLSWEARPWGRDTRSPDGIVIFAVEAARSAAPNAKPQISYQRLFHCSNEGIARCQMIFEDGVPVDFIYLEVNPRFEELTGLRDVIGKRVSEVIPGIQQTDRDLFEIYGRVAQTGEPAKFEFYVKALSQWFFISAFSCQPGYFTAIFHLTTEGKRVQEDLIRSSEEFLAVVNNSPDGIARLDLEGRYMFVNPRIAEWGRRGPADFIGQPLGSITGSNPLFWRRMVRHVVETRKRISTEYFFPHVASDEGIKLLVQFVPECDSHGAVRSILMFATNVTELERAQTIASERGSILETMFETAAQGIIAVDDDGTIRLINRVAEQMFGYEPGELLNRPYDTLLPGNMGEKPVNPRQGFLVAPKGWSIGMGLDLRGRRKDGSHFPVAVSVNYVNSRFGLLGISFITDITARKQQEEELRTLRASLLAAQEDASRELAQELHDDITQRLAFLSLEIGNMAAVADQPDALIRKLRSLRQRIQEVSDGIRQISHRLHPSVLDHLGLNAALQELCIFTEDAGSLTIHFESHGVPEAMDSATASCLYRVSQECMSNILKHARAKNVKVLLAAAGDTLQLTIADDGVGFDPDLTKNGVGTYSMRERVRLLNGNLSIESEPGKGTCIRVRLRLKLRSTEELPVNSR